MKILVGIFFLPFVISDRIIIISSYHDGRIIGGMPMSIDEVPYQASLQRYGSHICGGSIISTTWILSAGHCIHKRRVSDFSIRVGSDTRGVGGEVFGVAQIISHPKYNRGSLDFDFSLIRLMGQIALNGVTKSTIALPSQGDKIAGRTPVLVSGWGRTLNSLESNKVLRGAVIRTVSQGICRQAWDVPITSRMVCAAAPRKRSCNGDSGGPLKRLYDGVLIGVVSFGVTGCINPAFPAVYGRVASVRNWIRSKSGV